MAAQTHCGHGPAPLLLFVCFPFREVLWIHTLRAVYFGYRSSWAPHSSILSWSVDVLIPYCCIYLVYYSSSLPIPPDFQSWAVGWLFPFRHILLPAEERWTVILVQYRRLTRAGCSEVRPCATGIGKCPLRGFKNYGLYKRSAALRIIYESGQNMRKHV